MCKSRIHVALIIADNIMLDTEIRKKFGNLLLVPLDNILLKHVILRTKQYRRCEHF